jgi:hypothetical protein
MGGTIAPSGGLHNPGEHDELLEHGKIYEFEDKAENPDRHLLPLVLLMMLGGISIYSIDSIVDTNEQVGHPM